MPCTFLLISINWIFFCIILLARCEYDNQTYGIKQTFITLDCEEKCVCDVFSRNVSTSCSSLCSTPVDPVCKTNTQQVEVYQEPVKGTNCSCPAKKCITGLKLFQKILTDPYKQNDCVREIWDLWFYLCFCLTFVTWDVSFNKWYIYKLHIATNKNVLCLKLFSTVLPLTLGLIEAFNQTLFFFLIILCDSHCSKSVHTWSFSGLYFPALGLNTKRYSVSVRIQPECQKLQTRKTLNMLTFYTVVFF